MRLIKLYLTGSALIFGCLASWLMYLNIDGWGWLVFLAVLSLLAI